jgi:hypothetical protein
MTPPGEVKKRGRPRKWKRCPVCNQRKLIEGGFYQWKEYRGRPRESRLCRECTRKRNRERYERVMADPYLGKRERKMTNARAKNRDPELNRERCRRYREKLKRERPEDYQRMLEDSRIRARKDATEPPRWTFSSFPEPTDDHAQRMLPVEPLVEFIRLARAEGEHIEPRDVDIVLKAANHGYRVGVLVADRVITHAGGTLATVYPELYA